MLERGVWYPIDLIRLDRGDLEVLEQLLLSSDEDYSTCYVGIIIPASYDERGCEVHLGSPTSWQQIENMGLTLFMRIPNRSYAGVVENV